MAGVTGPLPSGSPAPARRRGRPSTLDREAVLDAAWKVIAERGLDGARYADVARESQVPVSTLQNAFGTRKALMVAAIERASERDATFLATVPDADAATAEERLEAFAGGAIGHAFAGEAYLVWLELWRASARDHELAEQSATAYHRWWDVAESIVAQGQQHGTFTRETPARDLAVGLVAMLDGCVLACLLPVDRADPVGAQRVALANIRQMLAPGPTERAAA